MNSKNELIDQLLILRCQLGDKTALEKLIVQHQKSLRYFIGRMIGKPEIAEDILQDTWLTVIDRIHTLKKADSFIAWLYRIARNNVYQELRRKNKWYPLDENVMSSNYVDDKFFSLDDAAKIHKGLEHLSPEHKEILMLRFLEQMTYQDMADVLGCNLGTVKSRIYYAKRALKQEMEK